MICATQPRAASSASTCSPSIVGMSRAVQTWVGSQSVRALEKSAGSVVRQAVAPEASAMMCISVPIIGSSSRMSIRQGFIVRLREGPVGRFADMRSRNCIRRCQMGDLFSRQFFGRARYANRLLKGQGRSPGLRQSELRLLKVLRPADRVEMHLRCRDPVRCGLKFGALCRKNTKTP